MPGGEIDLLEHIKSRSFNGIKTFDFSTYRILKSFGQPLKNIVLTHVQICNSREGQTLFGYKLWFLLNVAECLISWLTTFL